MAPCQRNSRESFNSKVAFIARYAMTAQNGVSNNRSPASTRFSKVGAFRRASVLTSCSGKKRAIICVVNDTAMTRQHALAKSCCRAGPISQLGGGGGGGVLLKKGMGAITDASLFEP